jgi:vancomycin aglycone glucosyltransferase
MRVLLSTYGSRGDVQPLAALAVALRTTGADAIVCAPPDAEFAALLERFGVPLAPANAPVRQWVSEVMKRSAAGNTRERSAEGISERAAAIMAAQVEALSAAAEGCDLIVAAGLFPSMAAARLVADRAGIRYFGAAFCPIFLPSEHHKPHAFPGRPHPPGVTDVRALWDYDIETKNVMFGGAFNRLRASMGLYPVKNVRDPVLTRRPLLAADPVLGPLLKTDLVDAVQTGAWMLDDDRPLPSALEAFLDAGEPPVYVGFGSMPMHALRDAASLIVAAIRQQGRRAVLSQGWAGLVSDDGGSDCFVVDEANHQALFPRVAAIVHHGGAGTTAAAARAGVPQVVVAQIADQPYWASRVAALGIGVAHEGATPTLQSFSSALSAALQPEMRQRASALAPEIRTDGAMVAARLLLAEAGT